MSADKKKKKNLTHALLSDVPVIETSRVDDLKFKPSAAVLARAALHTPDPITIGVFGTWGSGKTSLMRLMMDVIKQEGKGEQAAVPVWFNAWQYEREEQLIIPLLATIAREVAKQENSWVDKMKEGGQKIHAALRAVLYGLSTKGKLGVPGIGELEISASAKDMIARYEALTQDTLIARSLYFDAFDNLRDIASDKNIEKPKILVFVDDLDRCFPEQAVRLLESIKLVLHQPGFAFVLGIYPEIIEDFILSKYTKEYHYIAGQDGDQGQRTREYLAYFKEYLSKIIQVRHYVPQRNPAQMQTYIRALLEEAGVAEEFLQPGVNEKQLLSLIAEVGGRNPREVVRKLNGLIIKWRIRQAETDDPAKKYDLLAMLINEVLGEKEYDQLRDDLEYEPEKDNPKTVAEYLAEALQVREVRSSSMTHAMRCEKVRERIKLENSATMNRVLNKLELDEHVCTILGTKAGVAWLSSREYRAELRADNMELGAEEPTRKEISVKMAWNIEDEEHHPRMVFIKGGTFTMGDGKDDNNPPHTVTLSDFTISATPVTQAHYTAVMGSNPSQIKGDDLPVTNVSWEDAMVYCERLCKKTGKIFSLPTEAQWEYASRAGSEGLYCFGDDESKLSEYAWYKQNAGDQPHPVAAKKPNAWGLYDMHGNVMEWCADWYAPYPDGSVSDPVGPAQGTRRVLRGGGWIYDVWNCRSADRGNYVPEGRDSLIGFRLARGQKQK